MVRVLITGITGQDGSYLAEFLLDKGYEVFGMYRRTSTQNFQNISHVKDKIKLICGDLLDGHSLERVVNEANPDEIYNLAAMTFVHESFNQPHLTYEVNQFGVERLLRIVSQFKSDAKFYQASTSEMFGNASEVPQKETTPFNPASPYGKAKAKAHRLVREYTEDGMFCCGGILFNHESPRRGIEFVTRKITNCVAKIKKGFENVLVLGNLEAKRDWGFAGDYVKAMWIMLQQKEPEDYVIATGENHSVKEFIDMTFNYAGLNYEFVDLHDYDNAKADAHITELKQQKDKAFVVSHPKFFRQAEVNALLGDATKARQKLGWKPEVSFEKLVRMMVESDLKEIGC